MNQQLCNPNRLASFVRGELSVEAERALTAHLDECESCGQALEHQVAEASTWREASEFLGDHDFHIQDTDFSVGDASDAQIRYVLSQLSPTDDPDAMGRIGGYEVTGVIGSGGMGVVLKARDHSLDRVVAVKVMAPHLAAIGSARQRFAREAKAAAAVLHPNVIAIHGVSNDMALPYLVMPYVRGSSLQKRIDADGPLPLVDVLRIGAQVAAGLAAAHEQGLVHRDIKPGNILMEQGVERVTITDFGLARAVDDASMTRSGVIAGTPQYMSPEQARGEAIDARSDLFSLGSLLYAMCTGHSPFRAETSFGVLHRITQDSPRSITEINPDIPLWLEGVVMKLLSKNPEVRFQSAEEVAELLEGCLSHSRHPATTPLPESVVDLVSTKPQRRRRQFKFVATLALLGFFLLGGVLIVLELNKGTLRIESEADDVPIRIVQGNDVVEKLTVSKSGESVRIAAGNYQVQIDGHMDGLLLDNGAVTLQRGGDDVVRIVRVADEVSALGIWPYGRLMKDLRRITPPGGAPVIPPGSTISVAMGNQLEARLKSAPEGELDKWIDELERITGEELDGDLARQACRTYFANRMSLAFNDDNWDPTKVDLLYRRAQSLSPTEAAAWKNAFESLLGEEIGQTDEVVLDGGPSYAVPLALIAVDAFFNGQTYDDAAGNKYRDRLKQLTRNDLALWRSKVDEYGGGKIDAAINIVLLDDYFTDGTFNNGDFEATLDGHAVQPSPVRRLRVYEFAENPSGEREAILGREMYQVPDGPLLRIKTDQDPVFTEADLVKVDVTADPNHPSGDIVTMTLTDRAGERMLAATTRLSEHKDNAYLAIMFDGQVLSAPRVFAPISTKLSLTGKIDAENLVGQIRAAMEQVEAGPGPHTAVVEHDLAEPIEIGITESESHENHNARRVVESYIAAALTGDVEAAVSLAKDSPADPKTIQEIPEFLNVQRLKIETVYVNDPMKPTQALATSEAVKLDEDHQQPNGDRDGYLVFTLELIDGVWLVKDIDFETQSGAEKELQRFLTANPNSIGLPPNLATKPREAE